MLPRPYFRGFASPRRRRLNTADADTPDGGRLPGTSGSRDARARADVWRGEIRRWIWLIRWIWYPPGATIHLVSRIHRVNRAGLSVGQAAGAGVTGRSRAAVTRAAAAESPGSERGHHAPDPRLGGQAPARRH